MFQTFSKSETAKFCIRMNNKIKKEQQGFFSFFLHPLVRVDSGMTCPNGGLFASTFRFKFAGTVDDVARASMKASLLVSLSLLFVLDLL
jgi:hypothetical protein